MKKPSEILTKLKKKDVILSVDDLHAYLKQLTEYCAQAEKRIDDLEGYVRRLRNT